MKVPTIPALLLAALLCWLATLPLPVQAHRTELFAIVQGSDIHGQTGDLADTTIKIYGPGNKLLGETRTDGQGAFVYSPTQRVDHTLVLDTDDGHRAAFTVAATELPAALSAPDRNTAPAAALAELKSTLQTLLTEQLNPLRQEIHALEKRLRLQDILGGLGYITGLAGLLFFLRRKSGKDN
jgi:nickel transport protein